MWSDRMFLLEVRKLEGFTIFNFTLFSIVSRQDAPTQAKYPSARDKIFKEERRFEDKDLYEVSRSPIKYDYNYTEGNGSYFLDAYHI